MAVKCILTGQTPSVLDGVTENVQTQINAKAADSAVVHLAEDETISGAKTFTGKVVMNSSDNVGIGTAAPSEKLEVTGNIKATKFKGDGSELTNIPYPVTKVAGKAGAVTLAKGAVGLGNVDNTSDANKPISNATQTALNKKQDKLPNFIYIDSQQVGLLNVDGNIPTSFLSIENNANSFLSVTYSVADDVYYGFSAPLAENPGDGQRPNEIYLASAPYAGEGYSSNFTTPISLKNVADPVDGTDAANQRWAYNNTKQLLDQSLSVKGILKGDGAGGVSAAVKGTDYAGTSETVTATLLAASWTGSSAPYTYTLAVNGVTANSNQELLPALTITEEQLTALQAANIQDGGQAANSVTLTAFGDKPTIDLPIRVIVRGDS